MVVVVKIVATWTFMATFSSNVSWESISSILSSTLVLGDFWDSTLHPNMGRMMIIARTKDLIVFIFEWPLNFPGMLVSS